MRHLSLFAIVLAGCAVDTVDSECSDGKCDGYGKDPELRLADELPEHCGGEEVLRIRRPVSSDGKVRGYFRYGFRYKAPASETGSVLVVLPGGPGGASTGRIPDYLPPGWGYLLTDPRGVGCNTLAEVPTGKTSSAFFRTTEISQDIVNAIAYADKLGGDRPFRYMLFGTSYGTALGTRLAHDLDRAAKYGDRSTPVAVVLQGVLGRAFEPDEPIGAEYIVQWNLARAGIPADVLHELDTAVAPYGIDAEGWARALPSVLMMSGPATTKLMSILSTSQPANVQQDARTFWKAQAEAHATPPGQVELYRQVACREIADTTPANDLDLLFDHGKLVRNIAEEGTKCAGLHVTTPYDSAALQFDASIPVFYFLGDTDPATPLWQGAYHFDNREGTAVRVITKGGGHNPVSFNQTACAPAVLQAIATVGDVDSALAGCPLPVTVDRHD